MFVLNDYARDYVKYGYTPIDWDEEELKKIRDCCVIVEDLTKPSPSVLKIYSKLLLYYAHHHNIRGNIME